MGNSIINKGTVIWLTFGLLFGICFAIPLGGTSFNTVRSITIIEGDMWTLEDYNTLYPNNESWNVSIGKNDTTIHKLFVNGSTSLDSAIFNDDGSDFIIDTDKNLSLKILDEGAELVINHSRPGAFYQPMLKGLNGPFEVGVGIHKFFDVISYDSDTDASMTLQNIETSTFAEFALHPSFTPPALEIQTVGADIIIQPEAIFPFYDTIINFDRGPCNTTIHGDNKDDLLFVNAFTDRIGLNTTIPQYLLDVNGTVNASALHLDDNSNLILGTGNDATLYYDGANLICNPKAVGTGGFLLDTDSHFQLRNANTYMHSPSAGVFRYTSAGFAPRFEWYVGASEYLRIFSGNVVFNAGLSNIDTRMKSDTDANCFYLDASANNVGIGTNTPNAKLQVIGDVNVTGIINNSAIYAQLSDSTDQTFAVAGTGQAITFNTNDEINGITHSTVSDTENITIVTSGVYSIIAQPQVAAGAGDAGYFHMWLRRNEGSGFADVPNSNIELTLDSLDEDVIPLIVTISLNAGDIIRVNASVGDNGIELDAQTPAGEPAIPSIIFSMYRIGI